MTSGAPPASAADVVAVRERLGREPTADFEVVVRDAEGAPVVVRNAPLTRDGTPMPTRFWLVEPRRTRRTRTNVTAPSHASTPARARTAASAAPVGA
jgi:hypothetical protein